MADKIERMYAFVVTDDDGSEGIISMQFGATHMPLVGADMDRMTSLWPHAQRIGKMARKEVRLMLFDNGQVIDRIPAPLPKRH